jgi:hypothetical protein
MQWVASRQAGLAGWPKLIWAISHQGLESFPNESSFHASRGACLPFSLLAKTKRGSKSKG